MKQLLIGAILCVFLFAACDVVSTVSKPIDDIVESNNDDPTFDLTINPSPEPTDIPAVDPWSLGITTELRTEMMNDEPIYLIETWRDLEYLSANFISTTDLLTYTYHVTKNIRFPDLTDSAIPETAEERTDTVYESFYVDNNGLVPIGANGNPFIGTFDGLYEGYTYTITDLVINKPNQDNVGFFGVAGNSHKGAYFKNVQLENSTIKGRNYVGGLIGKMSGGNSLIEKSYVHGSVTTQGYIGGGLVGYIGQNNSTTIVRSHSSGSVTSLGSNFLIKSYTGGLIGSIINSQMITIEESYSTSDVTGFNDIGGLIGNIDAEEISITKTYATGNVFGKQRVGVTGYAGGLIGHAIMQDSTFNYNYAHGNTASTSGHHGGLFGYFFSLNTDFTQNYATGSMSNGTNIGGLVGFFRQDSAPEYNYWNEEAANTNATHGIGLSAEISVPSNAGAEPLSSSPQQSDFETWDFDGEDAVWVWNDGEWPTLAWQESN